MANVVQGVIANTITEIVTDTGFPPIPVAPPVIATALCNYDPINIPAPVFQTSVDDRDPGNGVPYVDGMQWWPVPGGKPRMNISFRGNAAGVGADNPWNGDVSRRFIPCTLVSEDGLSGTMTASGAGSGLTIDFPIGTTEANARAQFGPTKTFSSPDMRPMGGKNATWPNAGTGGAAYDLVGSTTGVSAGARTGCVAHVVEGLFTTRKYSSGVPQYKTHQGTMSTATAQPVIPVCTIFVAAAVEQTSTRSETIGLITSFALGSTTGITHKLTERRISITTPSDVTSQPDNSDNMNDIVIIGIRVDGTSRKITQIEGSDVTATVATASSGFAPLRLFGINDATGNMAGILAECIIFDSAVSDTDFDSVMQYLNVKWSRIPTLKPEDTLNTFNVVHGGTSVISNGNNVVFTDNGES